MENEQLALNIKILCSEKGITLSKLFEILNISTSFISDITKKNNSPSIKRIRAIADYFNVSIDYLIGRAEQPTKIEQNVSHNTLNDQSIGINNVQSIENNLTKELINEFEKLSFKNKSYVMNIIAELNEPIDQNFKMVASPSRPEPPKVSQKSIEEVKQLMKEIEEEKL